MPRSALIPAPSLALPAGAVPPLSAEITFDFVIFLPAGAVTRMVR
jgi:hypothetical protein